MHDVYLCIDKKKESYFNGRHTFKSLFFLLNLEPLMNF